MKKKESAPTKKNQLRPSLPTITLGSKKREILVLLSKGGNPHSISRKLRLHRSTIQYHLKSLKKLGLTRKENHLWCLTKQGTAYLGGGEVIVGCERKGADTTSWLQDRAHNIKIKVNVLNKPENNKWLSSWIPNNKLKNNVQYRKRFGEILTTYTGRSVIFQLPILHFKSSEIAIAEAGRIATALIKKYEDEIPGLQLGDHEVYSQLITQHHAIPNDPYAKFLVKHGITYRGKVIHIDASKKKSPELEFVDNEDSHLHHENYVNFVEDFASKEVPKASELTKILYETQKQVKEIAVEQKNSAILMNTILELIKPKKLEQPNGNISKGKLSYVG